MKKKGNNMNKFYYQIKKDRNDNKLATIIPFNDSGTSVRAFSIQIDGNLPSFRQIDHDRHIAANCLMLPSYNQAHDVYTYIKACGTKSQKEKLAI